MTQKFFPLDKNYLLKEAQASLRDSLLHSLIDKCKERYEIIHNPLRLDDAFSLRIKKYQTRNLKPLESFYQTLAGVYRFKHGDNQLEFLWDGQNHLDKYQQEWQQAFDSWVEELLAKEAFVQAILDLTVFLPENRQAHLAENRLNFAMLHFFEDKDGFPELRYRKTRGVLEMASCWLRTCATSIPTR